MLRSTGSSATVTAALCLLLLTPGCATVRLGSHADVQDTIREGRQRGLPLEDPLALDAKIVAEVRGFIGSETSQTERLRRLIRYLMDKGRLSFQYTSNASLTAQQAFEKRVGDCMAYTNLFIALARAVEVPMHFVRITSRPVAYENQGVYYVSTHMAAANDYPWGTLVVDFSSEFGDERLGLYDDTSDLEAFALFYNNVAMDAFVAGQSERAERLLRFLLEKRPRLRELYVNLGTVLMRERRPEEALAVLEQGIRQFPQDAAMYSGAAQAALGAGREARADALLLKTGELAADDPVYRFQRGMKLFHHASFGAAAQEFQRASRIQPKNPMLLSWMVRAYLSAGRKDEGVATYQRLAKLNPRQELMAQLQTLYPVLASAPAGAPKS